MGTITIKSLDDIHPTLGSKLGNTIKKSSIQLECPSCGSSLGKYSVNSLMGNRTFTCKAKDCGEKNDVDLDEIKNILNAIGRM